MTLEEALRLATKRVIALGHKPEDYFYVDERLPLAIAKAIVSDAKYLLKMAEIDDRYRRLSIELMRERRSNNLLRFFRKLWERLA